jgi:hypothetical protein
MYLPASSLQNQGITFNSKATSEKKKTKKKKEGKEKKNQKEKAPGTKLFFLLLSEEETVFERKSQANLWSRTPEPKKKKMT